MSDFDTYRILKEQDSQPKEYDIEDQITFDDLLEELKDRNNF